VDLAIFSRGPGETSEFAKLAVAMEQADRVMII
jgi:hypothetical protein